MKSIPKHVYFISQSGDWRNGHFGDKQSCINWYLERCLFDVVIREGKLPSTWTINIVPSLASKELEFYYVEPWKFVIEAPDQDQAVGIYKEEIGSRYLFYRTSEQYHPDVRFSAGSAEKALIHFVPFGAHRSLYLMNGNSFGCDNEELQDNDVWSWTRNGYFSQASMLELFDIFRNQQQNLSLLSPFQLEEIRSQILAGDDFVMLI